MDHPQLDEENQYSKYVTEKMNCHHDMDDKIDAAHNEPSSMWQVIEGELSRSRGIYFAR